MSAFGAVLFLRRGLNRPRWHRHHLHSTRLLSAYGVWPCLYSSQLQIILSTDNQHIECKPPDSVIFVFYIQALSLSEAPYLAHQKYVMVRGQYRTFDRLFAVNQRVFSFVTPLLFSENSCRRESFGFEFFCGIHHSVKFDRNGKWDRWADS